VPVIAWLLFTSRTALAQEKAYLDAQIEESIGHFRLINPRHSQLEAQAAGMLVFPVVTKGGMALAAQYGEGALQIHGKTVDYYSIASTSVGLTAGMANHAEIILFMTQQALDKFLASKGWLVGADAGIAVLDRGTAADYDSNFLRKPVLLFVFGEHGLIADLSVEGSKINKIKK
jgi:lipid-binding SYLF domain-containing protein